MWDTINVIIIKKGQSFSIDKLQVNDNNHSQYQMLSTNTSAAFQLNLYLNCLKQITVPRLIRTVKKNEVYLLCHLITVHVNFLNLFGHPKNKIKTS